jgi:folylpolyglutamate synthase/dihydropteroate synthase
LYLSFDFNIDPATCVVSQFVEGGFLNVIKNTGLQGRWQQLGENPTVICDTAHNFHGLKIVLNQLNKQKFEKHCSQSGIPYLIVFSLSEFQNFILNL